MVARRHTTSERTAHILLHQRVVLGVAPDVGKRVRTDRHDGLSLFADVSQGLLEQLRAQTLPFEVGPYLGVLDEDRGAAYRVIVDKADLVVTRQQLIAAARGVVVKTGFGHVMPGLYWSDVIVAHGGAVMPTTCICGTKPCRGRLRMKTSRPSVAEKRREFHRLHESGCFVIPNPWDPGSARYLQSLGFKALATTSAGFAWSKARPDNGVTRDTVIAHLAEMVEATDVPLNADFESGFARDAAGVAESVQLAVAAGVAGLSIEDSTGD